MTIKIEHILFKGYVITRDMVRSEERSRRMSIKDYVNIPNKEFEDYG